MEMEKLSRLQELTTVIKPNSVLICCRGLNVSVLLAFTLKSNHWVSPSGGTLGSAHAIRVEATGAGLVSS